MDHSVASLGWKIKSNHNPPTYHILFVVMHISQYSPKTSLTHPSIALTWAYLRPLVKKAGSKAGLYWSVGNFLGAGDWLRHFPRAQRRYNSWDQSWPSSQDVFFSLPLPSTVCYLDHLSLWCWLWYNDSVQTWLFGSAYTIQFLGYLHRRAKWEIIVVPLMRIS